MVEWGWWGGSEVPNSIYINSRSTAPAAVTGIIIGFDDGRGSAKAWLEEAAQKQAEVTIVIILIIVIIVIIGWLVGWLVG